MEKDNLEIKGYIGRWHVIEESFFKGTKVYLLEHSTYGDEAPGLWVDEDLNVIVDDVYNGVLDLIEAERV